MSARKTVAEYTAIILGGFLYALGTHFFIFAGDIILGGTGGVSVILERFLPFSLNDIITVINLLLLLLAFLFLGRDMGMKHWSAHSSPRSAFGHSAYLPIF